MSAKMARPTQKYLRKRLHYDPETGTFTWLSRPVKKRYASHYKIWNARYAGTSAGHVNKTSNRWIKYLEIKIDYRIYKAHRLAFLYMTGKLPPANMAVDHRDGDGLNNRWANIRIATSSQNCGNARIPKNNTSGFKGVSYVKASGRYHAYITVNCERINLGFFDTAEEAARAYKVASQKNFGEFARSC